MSATKFLIKDSEKQVWLRNEQASLPRRAHEAFPLARMNLKVRNTLHPAVWSRGRRRKRAFFRQQRKHRSKFCLYRRNREE